MDRRKFLIKGGTATAALVAGTSVLANIGSEFNSKRILLSYGFIIPYNMLGRTEDDYRVRLSKRIEKYFQ